MATGYTAAIKNGISFQEFALSCARAFGACIDMRDDPMDKPIPDKLEPDSYHNDRLKQVKKEISETKSMTIKQATVEAKKLYTDLLKQREESIKEIKDLKIKYEDMLTKVNAYKVPSSEHTRFKEFMIEQIKDSIKYDCNLEYYEKEKANLKVLSGKQYKENKLKQLKWDLDYHTKENEEEIKRNNERNDWIKKLKESLKI
jgi:hypothetical protein